MSNEISFGILFKQIYDDLEKRVNDGLRYTDLTLAQMAALLILREKPDKQMPLKELEHSLRIAQSTAAGIVSRLEQKGFVESLGQEGDKRIKIIRITDNGERCCLEADKNVAVIEGEVLSKLTNTEKDELLFLLRKIHG